MQTPRRFGDFPVADLAALPAPEVFLVYPLRAADYDPEAAQTPAYARAAERDPTHEERYDQTRNTRWYEPRRAPAEADGRYSHRAPLPVAFCADYAGLLSCREA